MRPALLTRLRPTGPWRYGPADGALDRVDSLYRSDRLYSAMTLTMQRLGWLEEWLEVTARASEPAIAFSSLFPFQGETLFATPPTTLWPPPATQVTAPNPVFLAKIRWKAATFVPLAVIDTLLTGAGLLAEQWLPDSESGCLLRRDRPSTSPFRTVFRRSAAVDRVARTSPLAVTAACVEFEPGAGLWTLTRYKDQTIEATWGSRIEAAFRLLADTGFGGRRTSGWGQTQAPEFQRGRWPALLLPKAGRLNGNAAGGADNQGQSAPQWLLSLYVPGPADKVDWGSGDYQIAVRSGRVENGKHSGVEKKALRMIAEGSVLVAEGELAGAAVDVAPDNFAHPVYRSGLALALELPSVSVQAAADRELDLKLAETETGEEEAEARPCDTKREDGLIEMVESLPVPPVDAAPEAPVEPIEQPESDPPEEAPAGPAADEVAEESAPAETADASIDTSTEAEPAATEPDEKRADSSEEPDHAL